MMYLSNEARVLAHLCQSPNETIRRIGIAIDLTDRTVGIIIRELATAEKISIQRVGRGSQRTVLIPAIERQYLLALAALEESKK